MVLARLPSLSRSIDLQNTTFRLAILYLAIRYYSIFPFFVTAQNETSGSGLQQQASDDNNDRANPFQVLADGTQDLAALIGLFATDSVERYSVDYSRGYLSVAVSTCSILGLLGYVRALVKLVMGSEACQQSAFPTAPLRPILGVATTDRLPKEEQATVNYVRKSREGDEYVYRLVKQTNHTRESFPLANDLPLEEPDIPRSYTARSWIGRGPHRVKQPRRSPRVLLPIWLGALLTSAATAFPVLLIRGDGWSWVKIIASFGLYAALAISHVVWSIVYVVEQIPSDYEDFSGKDNAEFAVLRPTYRSAMAVVCNLRAVSGAPLYLCKAITCACVLVLCVGYVCQYIVVRQSTTAESVRWLITHAVLALVRITVWIWDPKFDDFTGFFLENDEPLSLTGWFEPDKLALVHFSAMSPGTLRVPIAIAHDLGNLSTNALLQTSLELFAEEQPQYLKDYLLDGAYSNKDVWMLPPVLFSKLLGYKSASVDLVRNPKLEFTCVAVRIPRNESSLDATATILVPLVSESASEAWKAVSEGLYYAVISFEGSNGTELAFRDPKFQRSPLTSNCPAGDWENARDLLEYLRAAYTYVREPQDPRAGSVHLRANRPH